LDLVLRAARRSGIGVKKVPTGGVVGELGATMRAQ
jgi:hypothetical protein